MDFAVRATKQLVLIETSFYSGGGSKLKATAGEYKELHKRISRDHKFVWITDGAGWRTTHRPLAETFYAVDHILNLEMVQRGVLEAIMLE
jgi:type II restriction enzyme